MLPPAIYIDCQDDLARLVDECSRESLLAIDTESNSMYVYQEHVCLIQLSTREVDYIIDPLYVDVQPLASLLADPAIEKVFHAAEYDIMTMKRDFGFDFVNIFDTMTAARVCGFESLGLGALLYECAGVEMDKSHQTDDWGLRPLAPDSLRYAQMDTHFLPYLRDEFHTYLQQLGRLEEAREMFAEIALSPPASLNAADPDGFWKLGRPNGLNREQMLVLRELYHLRETLAQSRDMPAFRIMHNKALIAMSRRTPQNHDELLEITALEPGQIDMDGEQILAAIQRGQQADKLPRPPRIRRPHRDVMSRYTALHQWRKKRAIQRGVESDVIMSKNTLWDIAHKFPASLGDMADVNGMGPWRTMTYGEEILSVLNIFRERA